VSLKEIYEQAVRAQALYTETMERRMDANDSAANLGQMISKWKVQVDSDEQISAIEAELAKLTTKVAAMRALHEAVKAGTWKPSRVPE